MISRSCKEKRSSYALEKGVRYDGIYRIEKYWPKVGIQVKELLQNLGLGEHISHTPTKNMDIVSSLELALLQKIARRKNDFRLYADELGKGLAGELDYTLEAANASEFMVF
nr:Kinase superfamily protein isoform 1 [Ipomoea batatas]